jgi:hypothetical protein
VKAGQGFLAKVGFEKPKPNYPHLGIKFSGHMKILSLWFVILSREMLGFAKKKKVKYFFSTCALNQNQIATLVLKNITNGTCGYQINSLDTYIRIPLVFLTECHITLTRGMVPVISRRHMAWYLGF